jgi:hypothetical protein
MEIWSGLGRLEGRRSSRRRPNRNVIVIRSFFWALAKRRGYLAVPFRSAYLAASLWVWGKVGGPHACGATFSYIVPPPILLLNPFLSEVGVKRKDFPDVARLTWAQEARGSNPRAPTKFPRLIDLRKLGSGSD